jgi:hypothetical protein
MALGRVPFRPVSPLTPAPARYHGRAGNPPVSIPGVAMSDPQSAPPSPAESDPSVVAGTPLPSPDDPVARFAALAHAAMTGVALSARQLIELGVHCAHACPSPAALQPFIRAAERLFEHEPIRVLPPAPVPGDGRIAAPDECAFHPDAYAPDEGAVHPDAYAPHGSAQEAIAGETAPETVPWARATPDVAHEPLPAPDAPGIGIS